MQNKIHATKVTAHLVNKNKKIEKCNLNMLKVLYSNKEKI